MSIEEIGPHPVILSGPVTLYESSEVRDLLLAALEDGKDLRINLEASGPWDVAGLQLLIATVASAQRLGLDVRLGQVPGVCREVAERSGLGDWLSGVTDSFS